MKRYRMITLGCKVNQCESESIARSLEDAGWHPAGDGPADLCVINTCAVTHKAAMQSRQAVRQAIRNCPDARVMVTGCYAQTEPEALEPIEGIADIVGHGQKHRIPEMADISVDGKRPSTVCTDVRNERTFQQMPGVAFGERTRPFLKIQDGCDAFCTYCIVPYARGRSRSMPVAEVLENIRLLQAAGYREVVLSGIHIGCYGLDLTPETNLTELLERIDAEERIDRVRISSVEPHEITDEMIDRIADSERFCNHFHIPLQSGDDGILKRMGRPYDREFFRNLVEKIHQRIPGAAVGVDVLVGFPGESDAAFAGTYDLIAELPVTYLHVFPFSPRTGTPAADWPDQVSPAVVKSRSRRMRALGMEKRRRFYERFVGETMPVLVEGKRDAATGLCKGLSSNYLPVLFAGGDVLQNRFVRVRIEGVARENRLMGTLAEEK